MDDGIVHLARRFFASLRVRPPTVAEEAWLVAMLLPAEADLYRAQSVADRRHSIDCAHAMVDDGPEAMVASALHDVGKTEAGLGTFGRAGATVVARLAGRDRTARWRDRGGVRGRIGRYRDHDRRGADLLAAAGSADLVVAWAREHHEPLGRRSIDPALGARLARADG